MSETESGWPGADAGRALGRHVAEEQALGEFGIKASKMAPSQMEAVERMAAELTRLRGEVARLTEERGAALARVAEVEGAVEKGGHRCGGRYKAVHAVLCSSCRAGYDEHVVHFISGPALRDLEAFIRAESQVAAERRGAERALRWACAEVRRALANQHRAPGAPDGYGPYLPDVAMFVRDGLAALYPAPATDTQVQPPHRGGGREGWVRSY